MPQQMKTALRKHLKTVPTPEKTLKVFEIEHPEVCWVVAFTREEAITAAWDQLAWDLDSFEMWEGRSPQNEEDCFAAAVVKELGPDDEVEVTYDDWSTFEELAAKAGVEFEEDEDPILSLPSRFWCDLYADKAPHVFCAERWAD